MSPMKTFLNTSFGPIFHENGGLSCQEAIKNSRSTSSLTLQETYDENRVNFDNLSLNHGETIHTTTQQNSRKRSTTVRQVVVQGSNAEETFRGLVNESKRSQAMHRANITVTSSTELFTAARSMRMNGSTDYLREYHVVDGMPPEEYQKPILSPDEIKEFRPKLLKRMASAMEEKESGNIIRELHQIMKDGEIVEDFATTLSDELMTNGGMDIILKDENSDEEVLQSKGEIIETCLNTKNSDYMVDTGLKTMVNTAINLAKSSNPGSSSTSIGIIDQLLDKDDKICTDVVKHGGLDVLVPCSKSISDDTLRRTASAYAKLSLSGDTDNHDAMIKQQAQKWLFPLAMSKDDVVKYYAYLAYVGLIANPEVEPVVTDRNIYKLINPFVMSHEPSEFVKLLPEDSGGSALRTLKYLTKILSSTSTKEEALNVIAFHLCMQLSKGKKIEELKEIGVIAALKEIAKLPSAVAQKLSIKALKDIGEEVPYNLNLQVPLWTLKDVVEWVKQNGFADYVDNFISSQVDGDLLLQMTDEDLMNDIGITNGIRRKRFKRELEILKQRADYRSKDDTDINSLLKEVGNEFAAYTYPMLKAGVERESFSKLSEAQLVDECGITNSIQREKFLTNMLGVMQTYDEEEHSPLDVFLSYRRSNGSQLASLLKVYLELRGYRVFIDVERLMAGKIDYLLKCVKQAKHFILILTPQALQNCIDDCECKDWVHKEIVQALKSSSNIIPIDDRFVWPNPEELPEDMRAVCSFNGVKWIHDYQEACINKVISFIENKGVNSLNVLTGRITGSFNDGMSLNRFLNAKDGSLNNRLRRSPSPRIMKRTLPNAPNSQEGDLTRSQSSETLIESTASINTSQDSPVRDTSPQNQTTSTSVSSEIDENANGVDYRRTISVGSTAKSVSEDSDEVFTSSQPHVNKTKIKRKGSYLSKFANKMKSIGKN